MSSDDIEARIAIVIQKTKPKRSDLQNAQEEISNELTSQLVIVKSPCRILPVQGTQFFVGTGQTGPDDLLPLDRLSTNCMLAIDEAQLPPLPIAIVDCGELPATLPQAPSISIFRCPIASGKAAKWTITRNLSQVLKYVGAQIAEDRNVLFFSTSGTHTTSK